MTTILIQICSLIALALSLVLVDFAQAIDHRNLDAGVPLRIEDAYPLKFREPAFQGLLPYRNLRGNVHQGEIMAEVEYGVTRDWQINVGTRLFARSRGLNEGSGSIDLSALYNFNTETLNLPAFALKGEVEFPTGTSAQGVEVTMKGIITQSFGYSRFHLNLSQTYVGSPESEEKRYRWEGVVGWDRPIGSQSLLIVDLIGQASEVRGHPIVTALELGLRQQITPLLVVSLGTGVGLSGETERQPFFAGLGISRSF